MLPEFSINKITSLAEFGSSNGRARRLPPGAAEIETPRFDDSSSCSRYAPIGEGSPVVKIRHRKPGRFHPVDSEKRDEKRCDAQREDKEPSVRHTPTPRTCHRPLLNSTPLSACFKQTNTSIGCIAGERRTAGGREDGGEKNGGL